MLILELDTMTKLNEVYKCNVCGNIVEVLHEGAGALVCCAQNMVLKTENTQDAATEKHIPVVNRNGESVEVVVGEVLHPMQDIHYIEFIQVFTDKNTYTAFLKPDDEPKATFCIPEDEEILNVREYCNLHGLWSKK